MYCRVWDGTQEMEIVLGLFTCSEIDILNHPPTLPRGDLRQLAFDVLRSLFFSPPTMDLPAAPAGQATANTGLQDNPEISELPKSNHAPSKSSNRNASGNLPPVFKQSEAVESGPSSAPPAKPVNRPAASKNAIVHSVLQVSNPKPCTNEQRRNPVLALIRNVGLEIGDISVDFQVGTHNGVLFLR